VKIVVVIADIPLVNAAAACAPRSTDRSESSNISAFGWLSLAYTSPIDSPGAASRFPSKTSK
jgi:hypothetical protein